MLWRVRSRRLASFVYNIILHEHRETGAMRKHSSKMYKIANMIQFSLSASGNRGNSTDVKLQLSPPFMTACCAEDVLRAS